MKGNARKGLLSNAVAAARAEASEEEPAHERRTNPFEQRQTILSEISSGRIKDVRRRLVEPARCRMWPRHNRIYELLTAENCEDLISSIRAQGGQEFPAIVRTVKNDPGGIDFEVIAGARRHFAVSHLRNVENRKNILFLVEVRDLDDEEAFRLSDLENRDRKDISDYERGKEYGAALGDFYEGSLTRMAQRMEVSKALLSSYCALARLPREVLEAYGDVRNISVRHGQMLSPLLNDPIKGRAVIEEARGLGKQQAEGLALHQSYPLTGAEIFKRLKAAGESAAIKRKPTREEPILHRHESGKPMLSVHKGRKSVKLEVFLNEDFDKAAVLKAIRSAF